MKTTAEKSTGTTTPVKSAKPFFSKEGQEDFFAASGVQAKLQVNTPGDSFEKEADTTAEKVMQMPAAPEKQEEPSIRKKDKEEKETLQRECADCANKEEQPDDQIRRKETGGTDTAAPAIVHETLSGAGSPMDHQTRGFMESRFGADFSGVRVHNDPQSARSADSISAHAYTYGNHIVFNSGQYQPQTESGKKLLAHELTHVVQQGDQIRRKQNSSARPATGNQNAEAAPATPTRQSKRPGPQNRSGNEVSPATPEAPAQANASAAPAAPAQAPTEGQPPPGTESAGRPPVAEVPEAVLLTAEPLLQEGPETLSPEAQARLAHTQANARRTSEAAETLPSDAESTATARAGVTEPVQEADARAGAALTAELGQRPEPSPEIEALCERIREVIRSKRPPDEDSLLSADPEEAAQEAGTQLNENVSGDADRVGGEYNQLDETPAGTPEQIGTDIETPPESIGGPDINAEQAAPDALAPEDVSLDADVTHTQEAMDSAGMNSEPAQLVQDGPIAEARAAHGELESSAQSDPAEVLAQQDAALTTARTDMQALQEQALQALQRSRTGTITETATQQTGMVGSEESMRTSLGEQAETIFTDAQQQVNTLLEPLTRTAMQMWDTGKTRLATEFRQHLDRVQSWVDERHSGVGGAIVGVWDDLTGLPDWVTDEYDEAEQTFGDGVCDLIREISAYVNGIIMSCERLIDDADSRISALFENAPAELGEWASAEQERFRARIQGMRDNVQETRQNFNRELADRAAQAVQEVRQQIHELREKAKGLIGRIADAIGEFLDDPIRFIINGLLSLVGIEPARFWALVDRIASVISDIAADPLGFAGNLLSAIGAGFQRFFDNIGTHLFNGFINWLFSGLGAVGIEIPRDFSLSSIITFFLQLMGITWERVRRLLARHIGEENVALIEQAFSLVADLIQMGPVGIFEMIKDQLDPQHILDTIIDMAIDFLTEALIQQVTARVILLFNPVGAIAQAIEAIYRVLRWIFENASRIFTLIETVVNGIADILAGNIAGMAQAVETALAGLLTPVIDFLADYAGLGGLPERIADAVRGLQSWVEGILERVIAWLAGRARSLLSALGLGGEDQEGNGEGDGELGETERFTAGGEAHRLWVSETGGHVEIMVASDTPMSVADRLTGWEARRGQLPPEQQPEAGGLISTVRAQYGTAKQEGEQAKQKQEDARQHPSQEATQAANQEDTQLEQAERAMTPELGRLFDIFEGGVPFRPVEEQINLNGGTETVQIQAGANGHLEIQGGGQEISQLLLSVLRGPMAAAAHTHGRTLTRDIATQITPIRAALSGITVNNNRIPSAALEILQSQRALLKAQLERFAVIKAGSFRQLSTPPPEPIAQEPVEFAQQLGTDAVIIDEYDSQLLEQQNGLNRLTLDQWMLNRNAYSLDETRIVGMDAERRRAVLLLLRQRATEAEQNATTKKTRYQAAIADIDEAMRPENLNNPAYHPNFADISLVTNRFGNESTWRRNNIEGILTILQELRDDYSNWQEAFQRAAVLHNADQIAGGFGEIPDVAAVPKPGPGESDEAWLAYLDKLRPFVGSSRVNSSIGSLWRTQIADLERRITTAYSAEGWAVWQMNVELKRV